MTKPGAFSCPMARPFVRMEEMRTNFCTPDDTAASTRFTVPTLSTACAAFAILSGLPGTNPVAQTTASTPTRLAAIVSGSLVTSICTASVMPNFFALSRLRTPAMTLTPSLPISSLYTSFPDAPVAPTTIIVLRSSAAWLGFGNNGNPRTAAAAPNTVLREVIESFESPLLTLFVTLESVAEHRTARGERVGWDVQRRSSRPLKLFTNAACCKGILMES
mmetsp:Transcript_21020/g.46094  ORF Transcript_21020/g.46094 Transcript_21020/m.46094 type:complete len:219 (+) Transcript_21020:595-1251(+)